jgi:hypothetical protein
MASKRKSKTSIRSLPTKKQAAAKKAEMKKKGKGGRY